MARRFFLTLAWVQTFLFVFYLPAVFGADFGPVGPLAIPAWLISIGNGLFAALNFSSAHSERKPGDHA